MTRIADNYSGILSDFYSKRDWLQKQIRKDIKNKEYTLQDRWDLFVEAGVDILGIDPYNMGYIDVLDARVSLYDTFYVEPYSTKMYMDMLEQIEEYMLDPDREIPILNVVDWMEAVLEAGYAGFVYDW